MMSDEGPERPTTGRQQPPPPPPPPPRGKGARRKPPQRSRVRGRLFLALGFLLLVALGGLFAVIIAPAEAPRDCEPGEANVAASESGLDEDEIRIYSVCSAGPSENAWVHYVPSEGLGDQPMDALSDCVQGLNDLHETVNCYAYGSDEAFTASQVSRDGNEITKECWGAYLRQRQEEGGQGLIDNPNYESLGCPSA